MANDLAHGESVPLVEGDGARVRRLKVDAEALKIGVGCRPLEQRRSVPPPAVPWRNREVHHIEVGPYRRVGIDQAPQQLPSDESPRPDERREGWN